MLLEECCDSNNLSKTFSIFAEFLCHCCHYAASISVLGRVVGGEVGGEGVGREGKLERGEETGGG